MIAKTGRGIRLSWSAMLLSGAYYGYCLGCDCFAGTLPAFEEHEHICHWLGLFPSQCDHEDELALPLLEIVELLQQPFSELHKARRHALASSSSDSLEHNKRHAWFSPTLPKSTQLLSYLPITVDGSGQPLLSSESTLLPTASPSASIDLPPLLYLRAHISLHSTQTVDFNLVATKTINNSHEEAVLGRHGKTDVYFDTRVNTIAHSLTSDTHPFDFCDLRTPAHMFYVKPDCPYSNTLRTIPRECGLSTRRQSTTAARKR